MREDPAPPSWLGLAPALFVLLWSTGFIGAKLGLPDAEPFTFLLLRFLLVTAILAAAALATRAPWPRRPGEIARLAVAGLLIHATYLGGVFAAIHRGLPAGTTALITALQPLLTAVAAGPFLGERVTARQWLGLVLGLAGVALVVGDRAGLGEGDAVAVAWAGLAVLGITAGTLYQKRHGGAMDLRTGSAVQFAASAAAMAVLAPLLETMRIQWSGRFLFALGWLTAVLSLGAISLLMLLIRHGAAARTASLFYLVPPVTALMAWALFGERLGAVALAGMTVAVLGVALVVAPVSRPRPARGAAPPS
ncbi:DMT family transporter [Inmirania thermothiophila]|uniref:Drug/metabolite transporter (DMT)-like permease n=1 Tax=Inmirania thermothiophila TaxID=1750597 RepID=A0A3N1Y7S5_9GAMM|nr:DMT family transporter [Inmirania thermothiophila]ROR34571.1 drug/metabolite transporter (DMT)-like permease [Inmirania thermothiophila]